MPALQLNSGGNRKGLGTEDWGLATRAREPGTDKLTDRQTDGMTLFWQGRIEGCKLLACIIYLENC